MENVLFVNACVRGEKSRTLELANAYLSDLLAIYPEAKINHLNLMLENVQPLNLKTLEKRDALIESGNLNDESLSYAHEFADAQRIVIAAPYWDLSFPSILKIYIENIYAGNVVFRYTANGSQGLCKADKLVYFTTSGGTSKDSDFGATYLKAVADELGIKNFERFSAENLDIDGADVEGILAKAIEKVLASAK